jgi:hypothetical protein
MYTARLQWIAMDYITFKDIIYQDLQSIEINKKYCENNM